MKEDVFYKKVDALYARCMGIMRSKGTAYSGLEDKLGNFKRVAKNLAMTPEQVWYVYFAKHLDALSAFLRGEYKDSEPIEGRIMDLINYLFLLYAILEEKKGVIEEAENCETCDPGCCTEDKGEAPDPQWTYDKPNTEDSGDMLPTEEIVDPTERMLAKSK